MNDKFTKPGGILDLIKGTNDHRILKNKLDILEKGPATHKYKSRKRVGNKWVYEYDDKGDNNPTQKHRWSMALKQLAGSLAYDKELKPLLDGPIKQSDILTMFDDKHQAVMGIGKGLPNASGRVSAPYRGSLHLDIGSKGGMFRVMDGGQIHAEGKFAASGNIQPIHRNIKESILSMFDEYKKETEKSVDDTPDLEKGGEGSRGGKVVGHTSSGKPIYQSHQHNDIHGQTKAHADKHGNFDLHYANYKPSDHISAQHHHLEHSRKHHEAAEDLAKEGKHDEAAAHTKAAHYHQAQIDAHSHAKLVKMNASTRSSASHAVVDLKAAQHATKMDKKLPKGESRASLAEARKYIRNEGKHGTPEFEKSVKEEIVAQDQTFGIQYRPSITSMYGESK